MELSPKAGTDELVTILVVEDEPVLRAVTADDLRTRGYWVVEAGSAVEAAEILQKARVDLVFADIILPGFMGGLSFAVWLHERHPGVPLILTSGVKTNIAGLKGSHRVPFVAKPYDIDRVAKLIADTLHK
jgi:two-component system, response regulator PdtaR